MMVIVVQSLVDRLTPPCPPPPPSSSSSSSSRSDSTNQVYPYLRFIQQDASLADLIRGVIGRQARNILIDPYANA
jgi:uncharacterized protein